MGPRPPASRGSCGVKEERDRPALGSGEERASAFLPGALEGSRSRGGASGGRGGWRFQEKRLPHPVPPRDSLRRGKSEASRGGQVHRHLPHAGGTSVLEGQAFATPTQSPPFLDPGGQGCLSGSPTPLPAQGSSAPPWDSWRGGAERRNR